MAVQSMLPNGESQPASQRRYPRRPRKRAQPKIQLPSLERLDNRTASAQRAWALVAAIEADMGGSAALTEGARQLVRRVAVLSALAEAFEASWLSGHGTDGLADYLAVCGQQRRCLVVLGSLERQPKDVTPSLQAYVSGKGAKP